jgi:hypothetical protein
MRTIKSLSFFFSFLFIFSSINASINPVKSYVIKYQCSGYTVAGDNKNGKKQLDPPEYILHSCFRLSEFTTSNFQNVKNGHLFLTIPECKPSLFSKQYYAYYTAKRLHRFSDFPLYLRNRRLLI